MMHGSAGRAALEKNVGRRGPVIVAVTQPRASFGSLALRKFGGTATNTQIALISKPK